MNKIFAVLFIIVCVFVPLNVFAVEASPEEQIEAILETGHAYYRQGEQIQYDSYRKNLLQTPEDATPQHYNYTVCSAFVYQTYYQTLGIKLPSTTMGLLEYAKNNQTENTNKFKNNTCDNVLLYYGSIEEIYSDSVLGTKETSNYINFTKKMSGIAQPGDILVVTRACYAN